MIGEQARGSVKIRLGPKSAVTIGISYLELVLAGLSLRSRVEKVNCENLATSC